jgi:hypothetical protein
MLTRLPTRAFASYVKRQVMTFSHVQTCLLPMEPRTAPIQEMFLDVKAGLSPKPSHDDYKPAPLSPAKKTLPVVPAAVRIIPNPMESGPVAGKESGVINMDKWCGVCEREGHDSIDCPFEDAF